MIWLVPIFGQINTKPMARYSDKVLAQKQRHGKELYVKGFIIETIADITGMAVSTIQRWARDDDWETAKNSSYLALSELRQTILDSFVSLKNGEKPTIKPDEAAKYASAFEKLSDNRKVLSFMYEAFEMLTDELTKDVQNAKSKAGKENALETLKKVRAKTDTILTRLTTQALKER